MGAGGKCGTRYAVKFQKCVGRACSLNTRTDKGQTALTFLALTSRQRKHSKAAFSTATRHPRDTANIPFTVPLTPRLAGPTQPAVTNGDVAEKQTSNDEANRCRHRPPVRTRRGLRVCAVSFARAGVEGGHSIRAANWFRFVHRTEVGIPGCVDPPMAVAQGLDVDWKRIFL